MFDLRQEIPVDNKTSNRQLKNCYKIKKKLSKLYYTENVLIQNKRLSEIGDIRFIKIVLI